jgi:hypothetical protein
MQNCSRRQSSKSSNDSTGTNVDDQILNSVNNLNLDDDVITMYSPYLPCPRRLMINSLVKTPKKNMKLFPPRGKVLSEKI